MSDFDLGQFPPTSGMFAAPEFIYDNEFMAIETDYANQLTAEAINVIINELFEVIDADPDICEGTHETLLMAQKIGVGWGWLYIYNDDMERPQILFAPWPKVESVMRIILNITQREGGIVDVSSEVAAAFEKLTGLSCN